MTSFLFTARQNEIFSKQLEDFGEDLRVWNITNLWIPCIIILIPTVLYSFLPEDKATFSNLILNGSFSLLGVNILFTMSIFLINSLRLKDAKFEKEIIAIRLRLIIYLSSLLMFGAILYIIQIMMAIKTYPQILTVVFLFLIVLVLSVGVGKRVYLIKDELIGHSISEDIISNVKDLTNSLKDLD